MRELFARVRLAHAGLADGNASDAGDSDAEDGPPAPDDRRVGRARTLAAAQEGQEERDKASASTSSQLAAMMQRELLSWVRNCPCFQDQIQALNETYADVEDRRTVSEDDQMAAYPVEVTGHIAIPKRLILDGRVAKRGDRVVVFDEADGKNWCEAVLLPHNGKFSVSAVPRGASEVGILKIREFDVFGHLVDVFVLMQARKGGTDRRTPVSLSPNLTRSLVSFLFLLLLLDCGRRRGAPVARVAGRGGHGRPGRRRGRAHAQTRAGARARPVRRRADARRRVQHHHPPARQDSADEHLCCGD